MRLFVGISLPPELKASLGKVQKRLRSHFSGVKWVPEENFHITLRFIGNVESNLLPAIEQVVGDVLSGESGCTLSITGLGVFPSVKRPKVFWAGVEGEVKVLEAWAVRLGRAFGGLDGLPRSLDEEKPFRCHVTLARFRKVRQEQLTLLRKVLSVERRTAWGGFRVSKVSLFRSILTSAGAVYDVLYDVRLR